MGAADRRARVLAELGIVRWRLRERVAGNARAVAGGSVDPASHAADAQAVRGLTPEPGIAGPTSQVPVPEPAGPAVQAPSPEAAMAGLRVAAPDTKTAPTDAVAAAIWRQVLAWLGYSGDDVAWGAAGENGAIVLPPVATWRTPEGKRALWQALKAHVRAR